MKLGLRTGRGFTVRKSPKEHPRIIPKVMLVADAGLQIDFIDNLSYIINSPYKQTANTNQETRFRRRLYIGDSVVYKIWGPGYYLQERILLGIKSGLLKLVAKPLLGVIFNRDGWCCGYWMKRVNLNLQPHHVTKFLIEVQKAEAKTGCMFTDFQQVNMGHLDGEFCLIDLENCRIQNDD